MTATNYEAMGLDELRQYVLEYRGDREAFSAYIDRFRSETLLLPTDTDKMFLTSGRFAFSGAIAVVLLAH